MLAARGGVGKRPLDEPDEELETLLEPGHVTKRQAPRWQRVWSFAVGCVFISVVGTAFIFNTMISEEEAKANLVRMLGCFDQVMRENDITYWLDAGTLLGATREKTFIAWDRPLDVDLGCLDRDEGRIIALRDTLNERCGYYVSRQDYMWLPAPLVIGPFVCRRGAHRLLISRTTAYYLDVSDFAIVHDDDRAKEVLYDTHFPEHPMKLDLDQVIPTVNCPFEGITVQCPNNVDYYLTKQYGPDWRIPKKGFKSEDSFDT